MGSIVSMMGVNEGKGQDESLTEIKLDRQLRIWSRHGQRALFAGVVRVVGTGSPGESPGARHGADTEGAESVLVEELAKNLRLVSDGRMSVQMGKPGNTDGPILPSGVTGVHVAVVELAESGDSVRDSVRIAARVAGFQAHMHVVSQDVHWYLGRWERPDWRLHDPFPELAELADSARLDCQHRVLPWPLQHLLTPQPETTQPAAVRDVYGTRRRELLLQLLHRSHRSGWLHNPQGDRANRALARLAYALLQYHTKYAAWPLSPIKLPDMDCDPFWFRKLQMVYSNRSIQDRRCFEQLLTEPMDPEIIDLFYNNYMSLGFIEPSTSNLTKCPPKLENTSSSAGASYMTATFLAGVISQEIIKRITHEFIPISGDWFYDALNNVTSTN